MPCVTFIHCLFIMEQITTILSSNKFSLANREIIIIKLNDFNLMIHGIDARKLIIGLYRQYHLKKKLAK